MDRYHGVAAGTHWMKICSLDMQLTDEVNTTVLLGFQSMNIYKHFMKDNSY